MFFSKIKLQSLLPVDPIEEFDSWAWGEHPNGLGYKARNSLTKEQCVLNPTTAGTVHCRNYDYSYPVDICIKYPEIAGLKVCQGNRYPAEVCASSLTFALLEGCAGTEYPAEVCASNIQFALLEGCADALYPKEFCVANPVLVSAKGCQKYLADICSLDVKLALSPPCAGAADQITRKQCTSNGDICRAKICDKRVPNKDFCKA
ncbi:uncharacterized protein LOC111716482 isoform X7 [Eurytemora carolleeae]|uniref:uncharacterized protein LOC111716482 isoform X7 n=1 Tax=Eurytemora carolleeae TaxID=1294199 RepID=UPI000C783AC9|nr:uncharacterized protein LOC111716482 isoform X7 [Eurytemora carolleeae]|eukprot:XP_023347721.1 uncharacterized protein LOC111716482 isoform X7 [Eurytemora affinis]